MCFCLKGQTPFEDNVLLPLQKNSIPQEKIFVHTNKTSFFVDDIIWFKAYVANSGNGPSTQTTSLTVNLLSSEKELIFEKNIFIFKGVGTGQFELNTSLLPGRYYLQAYTNHSRNFGDSFIYLQEIVVLGKNDEKGNLEKTHYDIQVLPEGGYLLEDTENTIGIKSMINGQGSDFSGKIINSKNDPVADFTDEHLGMTKSGFFYEKDEKYSAIVKINDTLIKVEMPIAKSNGVLLSVDNLKDSLLLSLKTNKASLNESVGLEYYLLYHQRNKIIGFLGIEMSDSLKATIKSAKNIFPEGVNTVTLFENNRPIAERKFFIEKTNRQIKPAIKKINTETDSVVYKLDLKNTHYSSKADLSISILPAKAKNFDEKQNIKSSFLLKPFVKGHVANPAYYFKKENKKRKEHLDLLLLTQGWSKYSLEKMIGHLNPKPTFDFEIGNKLSGEIMGPLLHDRLALISRDDKLIDAIFLNSKKRFLFDRLLIYKGDTLKISYLNKSGEALKPNPICLDTFETNPFPLPENLPVFDKSIEKIKSKNSEFDWFPKGTIALDEVLLTGKKKSEVYLRKRKIIKEYKQLVFDIGRYYEVPLLEKYKDFNDDLMSFLRIRESVNLVNQGAEYYLKVPFSEALLFIDGRQMESFDLPSIHVKMENIKHIMVKIVRGGGRVYQVFTDDNYKKNVIELFNEHIVQNGYDKEKEYYLPFYEFENDQLFDWMEIDWKPKLKTNENGEAFFKIKVNEIQNNYLFSIQGFTNDGLLISEILHN